MVELSIKISKVNWVMGDMVSLTRQGDTARASEVLLDMLNGQIIREPIRADIREKKCAFFGHGKVVCLTQEANRYALYLPRQGDLSSALKLGIHGDIISPYKYRFEDNPGEELIKGLLIACSKIS